MLPEFTQPLVPTHTSKCLDNASGEPETWYPLPHTLACCQSRVVLTSLERLQMLLPPLFFPEFALSLFIK